MVYISKKVEDRIKSNLSKYKRILRREKDRDINESDTVKIVTDILSEIMGYDKYGEITSEYMIRGTYCDLAVKIEDNLYFLIEVKRIGLNLKEDHMRQAVNYASNEGIEHVILTNGVDWEVYKVSARKKIMTERIFTLNLLETSPRDKKAMEQIFSISREGIVKPALEEIHEERRVTNRYTLAALLMDEPILGALMREIRKISNKGVKVDDAMLLDILKNEVLKRDVLDGEKADHAAKFIKKRKRKIAKKKAKEIETTTAPS